MENPPTEPEFVDFPLGYHITIACYGARLQGHESGSVDRTHNTPETPYLKPDPIRVSVEKRRMKLPPCQLNPEQRKVVIEKLLEVCEYREWFLVAAHARMKHVHIIVQAAVKPEKVMGDFKSYCTRGLNRSGIDAPRHDRWAEHGSTIYLWNEKDMLDAVNYVLYEQGEPMEVYPPDASKLKKPYWRPRM